MNIAINNHIMNNKTVYHSYNANKYMYVLVTPARNEEKYIEKTINSVISQTILPIQWVIISDGSTDKTDDIVISYSKKYKFIKYIRIESGINRNFNSKAFAIKAGYEILKKYDFYFIGNLDADVSFEKNYFENIIKIIDADCSLGIVGGIIVELVGNKYKKQKIDMNSVAGAVQLFRKKCYEDIGGYIPLKIGGIDSVAEIMARMSGWKVRTYPEFEIIHHRRVLTSGTNILNSKFKQGMIDYCIGYHPMFEVATCLYRLFDKPVIIGSVIRIIGYLWLTIKREEKLLPVKVINYLRIEQLDRLKSIFLKNKK